MWKKMMMIEREMDIERVFLRSIDGLLQMSSLLIADVIEDNSDDVDTDAPVLDVLVDEVSRQVLLAVAARPNAHHLVGLEY